MIIVDSFCCFLYNISINKEGGDIMEKMYWFSTWKHAIDVEFRYNRLENEMYEMRNGIGRWAGHKMTKEDFDMYDKMEALAEKLDEVRDYMVGAGDGAVKLPGRLYSVAMDAVLWATNARTKYVA